MMCKKITVSGRVQGVGFRVAATEKATKLGLTGYAKNLGSGAVEIVMCGEEEKINVFSAWAQKGPSLAHVDNIHIEELPPKKFEGFEQR